MKSLIKRLYYLFKNFVFLFTNYSIDLVLYFKHSLVFSSNTFNKIEAKIILNYHSIEKGFLHDNFRFGFGKQVIQELTALLSKPIVIENKNRTQIASAYQAICTYYEFHKKNNFDISDFFNRDDYNKFKNLLTTKISIVNQHSTSDFFQFNLSKFPLFAQSRKSIRNFTGELIPLEKIERAIEVAKTAPSVCNRQPTKVYYTDNKKIIEEIFDIQKGLKGYTDSIYQLLVVVSDRNYYYKIGERNQLFTDGGIFVMNLLYALHYEKIGACPAHWGLNFRQDIKIKNLIGLSNSEKVICLIPIGIPKREFKTALSLRRSTSEILKIIQN